MYNRDQLKTELFVGKNSFDLGCKLAELLNNRKVKIIDKRHLRNHIDGYRAIEIYYREIGGSNMNYMKQVAVEVLGLEWDDENCRSEMFDVLDSKNEVHFENIYFNNKGIFTNDKYNITDAIRFLLDGSYTIREKLKIGDHYYVIDGNHQNGYVAMVWHNGLWDNSKLELNRIYKTKQEVKEAIKKLGWEVE